MMLAAELDHLAVHLTGVRHTQRKCSHISILQTNPTEAGILPGFENTLSGWLLPPNSCDNSVSRRCKVEPRVFTGRETIQ